MENSQSNRYGEPESEIPHTSGEPPQSPDISLSSQHTLRYSDVEAELKTQKEASKEDSSDSGENFEDAAAPPQEEQAQFKNSFYEKLSVTCQNLENTVASLQKPQKFEEPSQTSVNKQIISKTNPEVPQQDSTAAVSRPETLSLTQPTNQCDRDKKDINLSSYLSKQLQELSMTSPPTNKKDNVVESGQQEEVTGAHYIEPSNLSPNVRQGIFVRKGDMIEFVADNLEEKIKQSSPMMHTDSTDSQGSRSSRRSSVRSIVSASSSTSFATSSGVSRSPSSFLQQSPDDIPPIDAGAVLDLENHAQRVADSLDLMMGNIRNNLHKMSAITIGCQDAYKRSVDITCDSADSSIKTMYALMAKCEELSQSMVPVEHLAAQIREIKRILDLFELQLTDKDK